MRAVITTALGLFAVVVAYMGLQRLAQRFFAGKYRAETAAGAVVLAFVVGLSWPHSDRPGASIEQAAVASPALAAPPAPPASAPTSVSNAPVDVGKACASARLATSAGNGSLDQTTLRSGNFDVPVGPHTLIHATDFLVARGWAADPELKGPAAGACLLIDGKIISGLRVLYGASRPDVANAYRNTALSPTQFVISLPALRIEPGRHRVTAVAVTSTGSASVLPGGIWIERAPAKGQ